MGVSILNTSWIELNQSALNKNKLYSEKHIGKQGDLNITVSSFAELTKMINYELLSRLPQQIPRVVI